MSVQIRQKPPLILLGLLIGIAIALLAMPVMAGGLPSAIEPAPAAQETEPIFALPGVLQKANNQPFDTFLVTNDNVLYGLVGKTPEIEAEITAYRDQGTDTEVKVWGTLYPNGRMSNKPEIIVSNIQSDVAAARRRVRKLITRHRHFGCHCARRCCQRAFRAGHGLFRCRSS